MVVLRLFAHLRELAGTGRVELDARDVAGVIDEACRRFGPRFRDGVRGAAIWVDGEPLVAPDAPITPGAEVALIPPVSGGAA